METISYALTTRDRFKTRLQITNADFDALFDSLIAAVTDLIENKAGRRFLETTYTNEVYSVYGAQPEFVCLKQAPVSSLTSFQYRAGIVSSPSWTDFITDQYELLEDGESGIIRVYGGVPRGVNAIRATYKAGFKIDFTAVTDTTKHTLPFDLTDLAERLVTKLFKRREAEGKQNEAYAGGQVSWKELLDPIDIEIINSYSRPTPFV